MKISLIKIFIIQKFNCKSLSLQFIDKKMKLIQNNYLINGEIISSMEYNNEFKYLGNNTDLKLTYEKNNFNQITNDIKDNLEKVKSVNISNWMKITLIKIFIIQKFNFICSLSKTKKAFLRPIDDEIKNTIYDIHKFPPSTTTNIMYVATKKGGIGMRKLQEDKSILRLSSFINLLNTKDKRLKSFIHHQNETILGCQDESTINLLDKLMNFGLEINHKCSSLISDSIRTTRKLETKIIQDDISGFDYTR